MENELAGSSNINQEISGGRYGQEGNNSKLIFLVVALIILVAAGVLFFKFKSATSPNEAVTPTPTVTEAAIATATPTPTVLLTPSVTTVPSLTPKQQVKIEILNGTGKAGEAAYLKSQLAKAGFGTFTLGNADNFSTEAAARVTFYNNFAQNLRIDLVSLLENIYASVSSQVTTDSGKFDAVIVTGKRK